jgi:hypothetical protein
MHAGVSARPRGSWLGVEHLWLQPALHAVPQHSAAATLNDSMAWRKRPACIVRVFLPPHSAALTVPRALSHT